MGDPAGVGPEITIRALMNKELRTRFRPVLVGSERVFERAAALFGNPFPLERVSDQALEPANPAAVGVYEPPELEGLDYPRGAVDPRCGDAAFRSIEASIRLAMDRRVAAVVTNPIHKKALNDAGHHYNGHTEIFRDLSGAKNSAMMLVAEGLRVVHVTTHCSLRQAVDRVKKERILEVIRLTHAAMRALGIDKPRLGVAALNPHAGDGGLFGDEETTEILPASVQARAEGIDASDPLPSDTIFSLARGGRFDAVVVMYHDQGHIPVKLIGFIYDDKLGQWTSVSGINVTLGLPILRVSVDHGTAFDQAWKGQASPASLENAIDFAIRMSGQSAPSKARLTDNERKLP
jgi:4-hydroxythreonine-4-phosphate dehydrogenase